MGKSNICISRAKRNGCKILTVVRCIGKSCPFSQTKKQAEASLRKAYNRLASLDKEQQLYISDKYYDGEMPWIKGGAKI